MPSLQNLAPGILLSAANEKNIAPFSHPGMPLSEFDAMELHLHSMRTFIRL